MSKSTEQLQKESQGRLRGFEFPRWILNMPAAEPPASLVRGKTPGDAESYYLFTSPGQTVKVHAVGVSTPAKTT